MAAKKRGEAEIVPPTRSPDRAALTAFLSKQEVQTPREVLRKVRAVPTIFPYYDWATGVGGHPLERVSLVHGPSSHGKTTFCHGLGLSFLLAGHCYDFVDAEMTTPITWLEGLMGAEADNQLFWAHRPTSYEETVDQVRAKANMVAEMREKQLVPPETSCLFVVDSIKKLVPKKIMEKILKGDEKGGVDGMGGRAAQIKAALNAAWMDELVPLMHETGCTMVLIARESENTDKQGLYDADWKLTGGKAIFYDSSLVSRITRASWVKEGSGEDASVIGEKHKVNIYKTKIAGKDDKSTNAYFNTSNGGITPAGFDRARDLIELADKFGLVEKSGSWMTLLGERYQGVNKAVVAVHGSPSLTTELDAAVRECFAKHEVEVEASPEA